jgi:hypothetical protein
MTKELARRFFRALDVACRRRSRYDRPATIIDSVIRDSPALWREVQRAVTYEWAINLAATRLKATPAAPTADQLRLFD